MKLIKQTRKKHKLYLSLVFLMIASIALVSCDPSLSALEFDLPDEGTIADATPPAANFSATQSTIDWRMYNFANFSTSATTYAWDFGDGNTSTAIDGVNTYPGEGTYTVTLTASDALGVTSTYSEIIEVVEPEAVAVPDPIIINADFDLLPKSSGSDCSCAGWINKDIGDQGESSSGNGGSNNVIKFDNNEPDHIYQEFEVTPNSFYTMTVVVAFQGSIGGSYPSSLELRVLAGSGYINSYMPTYYTNTVDFPQEDWGYTSISQVEMAANNLLNETIVHPNNTSYNTYTFIFNSGANDSVALFVRGIGGPSTGGAGGNFGYNSGDEEIRMDSVTITANN